MELILISSATTAMIIMSCVAGILAIATITFAVLLYRLKKKSLNNFGKADKVKVVDGVRYSVSEKLHNGENVNITYNEGDLILEKGKTYTVKKGGKIIPGKYTALASGSISESFNLRLGGFVREFAHADSIVLSEGEEICAVSHSVVLR